jgi:hypothetical protein
MLDLNHLIKRPGIDVQVFAMPSDVTQTQFHTWTRPRGSFSTLYGLCIGGGNLGGNGFTRVAGAAGGGGGGGGSSGHARIILPIDYVTQTLYIQVSAVNSGVRSYICAHPDAQATTAYALSSGTTAGVGGNGTGAAAGAGGSAASVPVINDMSLAGIGNYVLVAGQAGSAGGAQTGAAGSNLGLPTGGVVCMGGTGGGGTTSADFAGGPINISAGAYLSDIRPIQAPSGSNRGADGFTIWKPFFNFPGMGGGSSNAGVGGNGGIGNAYGVGGGGGGAGTTGGAGGSGGPGVVIIICW